MKMFSIPNLMVLLLLLAGVIWLQVYLSKKKERLLGFILPIIIFLFSLDRLYWNIKTLILHGTENGVTFNSGIVGSALSVFLILNIPTIIFLLIYSRCRKNVNRSKELEKMNIQDLE